MEYLLECIEQSRYGEAKALICQKSGVINNSEVFIAVCVSVRDHGYSPESLEILRLLLLRGVDLFIESPIRGVTLRAWHYVAVYVLEPNRRGIELALSATNLSFPQKAFTEAKERQRIKYKKLTPLRLMDAERMPVAPPAWSYEWFGEKIDQYASGNTGVTQVTIEGGITSAFLALINAYPFKFSEAKEMVKANPSLISNSSNFIALCEEVRLNLSAESLDLLEMFLNGGADLDATVQAGPGEENTLLGVLSYWPGYYQPEKRGGHLVFLRLLIGAGMLCGRYRFNGLLGTELANTAVQERDVKALGLMMQAGLPMDTMTVEHGDLKVDGSIWSSRPGCVAVLESDVTPEWPLQECIKLGLKSRVIKRLKQSSFLRNLNEIIKTVFCIDARREGDDSLINLPLELWAVILNQYFLSTKVLGGLTLAQDDYCELAAPAIADQLSLKYSPPYSQKTSRLSFCATVNGKIQHWDIFASKDFKGLEK